jgi:hypothetical protein
MREKEWSEKEWSEKEWSEKEWSEKEWSEKEVMFCMNRSSKKHEGRSKRHSRKMI